MPRTRRTGGVPADPGPRELGWEDFRRQAILVAMRGDRAVVEDLIGTMGVILHERAGMATVARPVYPAWSSGQGMSGTSAPNPTVGPDGLYQSRLIVPPAPATPTASTAPTPRETPPVNEATPLGTPRRRRRRGMPADAPPAVDADIPSAHAAEEPEADPGEAPLPYIDPAFDPAASESGL